jgi:FkbM family methyltransferase
MSATSRLLQSLISPWAMAIGQVLKNERLISFAGRLDPNNLKSEFVLAASAGQNTETASRLLIASKLCLATQKADQLVMSLLYKSRAQLLQDIAAVICNEAKRGGYFVEVGVGDGRHLSNTLLLEEEFGWSGLLVEPNIENHAAITAHRKAKLAIKAAYSVSGEKVMFTSRNDVTELSGITTHLDKKRLTDEVSQYEVETARLDDLLEEAKAPTDIDFMSIDTEGSELEILSGLSLDRWKINMLAIEHNHEIGKLAALEKILQPFGYSRVFSGISQFDAWFIHSRVKSKYLL